MNKKQQTLRFCHALLGYGMNRCRAMANFVMSLASSPLVRHPVELSASPFCHYHYSNLTKIVHHWEVSEKDFRGLIRDFLPAPRRMEDGTTYYALTHDVTKLLKAHSPCLEDRQYVPTSNNVIAGNRALGVGYPISALHLGTGQGGWCPPLALARLRSDQDANSVAVEQIKSLLEDQTLPFGKQLCLSRVDAAYGKAIFLSPMYEQDDLVVITRLRPGMKVWTQAHQAPEAETKKGARRIYGEKFYLSDTSQNKTYHKKGVPYSVWQKSLCEQLPNEHFQKPSTLANNRQVILDIRRWNNLLMRTKQGASMKFKPLDVLRIQVLDHHSQVPIFDRPLFVALSGKRKNQVDSALAQSQYRERFDVEPYYRFAKNNLLIDKLQTPTVEHLDRWLRLVQASSWLLFTAQQEIPQLHCSPWQKYLPKNKAAQEHPLLPLSIAQTQKSIHLLFSTFDPAPFLPLKCKKGKGRKFGQSFPKKTRFPVVKKVKKSIKIATMQQKE